jgi:hypothetical protein
MLEAQGKEPPTMKEHTKAVLEACTGQLVALGLLRRRRGLAVWQMNEEMWGGVGMQVQLTRHGATRILPVAQLVWDPVERLVAHGKGTGYRPWSPAAITRARVVLPAPDTGPIEFISPEVRGDMLDRFARLVQSDIVPTILNMADEGEILRHYRAGAGEGVGRAEHALAILAWVTKSLDLGADYGSLLSVQTQDETRSRLQAFHHRLTGSREARVLIGVKTAD